VTEGDAVDMAVQRLRDRSARVIERDDATAVALSHHRREAKLRDWVAEQFVRRDEEREENE
jgi:hypothetical protein